MVEVSNLRRYNTGKGMVRLEADINFTEMDSPYPLKTIYFETKEEYADMLDDESYNAFVLVPLFVAMFHKQDLHICGKISRQLYHNVKCYVWKIFCDYSPNLSPVNFTVDGFTEPKENNNGITGASISSGVDALATIYDHFICEEIPNYKINALFYFGHDRKNSPTLKSGQNRFRTLLLKNQKVAQALNLPFYYLVTNLSAFNIVINKLRGGNTISMSYIALYSCILSLGRKISRYYIASALTYEQEKIFRKASHDKDMSEFFEAYLVPLIRTEQTELILDGCQYRRVEKLKRIVDWDIARKFLNVCWFNPPDGSNCGECLKCLRTLLALEIMGKLDDYSDVFDIEKYKSSSLKYKRLCLRKYNKAPFETENVDFARENNYPMPTLEKK